MGGSACVAGSPSRIAAVGIRRFASTTAFVKWVVPIITPWTCGASTPLAEISERSAETIPLVTSGVVGVFTSASTRRSSISTASVFVPPTSIPIRIAPPPTPRE
jgi:hypothetical protein